MIWLSSSYCSKLFLGKISGHIQAVYVQNSLKLFCYIAEKMLEAEDTEKAKQVHNRL